MHSPPTIQAQALYSDALPDALAEIDRLRAVKLRTPTQTFRLACLEEYVEDLMDGVEMVDAMLIEEAERARELVEVSEALDRAIYEAQVVGAVMVNGARRMGCELGRKVPGCMTRRGALTTWCVEVAGGQIRLTVMDRAYKGAMSFTANNNMNGTSEVVR